MQYPLFDEARQGCFDFNVFTEGAIILQRKTIETYGRNHQHLSFFWARSSEWPRWSRECYPVALGTTLAYKRPTIERSTRA